MEVGVIVMVYIGREKMEVMHKVVIVRYSLTSLCRRDKDSGGERKKEQRITSGEERMKKEDRRENEM